MSRGAPQRPVPLARRRPKRFCRVARTRGRKPASGVAWRGPLPRAASAAARGPRTRSPAPRAIRGATDVAPEVSTATTGRGAARRRRSGGAEPGWTA